jgi:cytosine/creatinine deaminase
LHKHGAAPYRSADRTPTYAFATERGARTLGVEDEYGSIEEGKQADCVVFDAPSALEVLRLHPARRWVVRRGRVIAETEPSQTTLLGEPVTFRPPV